MNQLSLFGGGAVSSEELAALLQFCAVTLNGMV
jgi:hypothetical protein